MYHAQHSCIGLQAFPPRRLPLRPRDAAGKTPRDRDRAAGVFGAITIKWYSEMAGPRDILGAGSSRRKLEMRLSEAEAAGSRHGDRGPIRPLEPVVTNWGNDMMHLWATREPGPSRPHSLQARTE